MEQQNIKTSRCVLRPAIVEDATWMFRLFNDKAVIAYIEGIQWFNKDIDSVVGFIRSMEVNSRRETGMLWSIIYNEKPVGFIMVNDLDDTPFLTFALFPEYRGLHLGTEVYKSVNRFVSEKFTSPRTETKNPVVKKILRHSAEILFINGQYFNSLVSFKNFITSLDAKKKQDLSLIDDVLALFRDGTILNWLYYLSENGDEEALNIADLVLRISSDGGDRYIFRTLLNVFSGNQTHLQNGDISFQIRLCQTATLFIPDTEAMLDRFKKNDDEWERRGRNGFNFFWNK